MTHAASMPSVSVEARADLAKGAISVTAVLPAPADRVFRALASPEICAWWVRPGIFDTREWHGDVRVGGHWDAAGIGGGQLYRLEGEFLEIDPPHRLVHTWKSMGAPGAPALVTYRLAPENGGTCLTLDHTGILVPDICERTRAGWETSFVKLAEILMAERGR